MSTRSLRGQLLLSGGGLFDPNFRQTVVLIGEHNADGALGVVLNRPAGLSVAEAFDSLASMTGVDPRVFRGGPVQPGSAVVLAEFDDPAEAGLLVFGRVGFLTGDVSEEAGESVRRARVFAGYAGWGTGQLEAEMAEGSWIVEPARVEDVFTDDPDSLYRRVLERKGGRYRQLARVPFDPSTN